MKEMIYYRRSATGVCSVEPCRNVKAAYFLGSYGKLTLMSVKTEDSVQVEIFIYRFREVEHKVLINETLFAVHSVNPTGLRTDVRVDVPVGSSCPKHAHVRNTVACFMDCVVHTYTVCELQEVKDIVVSLEFTPKFVHFRFVKIVLENVIRVG